MTLISAVTHLLSFLRPEQRAIPHLNTDLDDPLPHAVGAVNAALQTLAVASPLLACKKPKSAWFRSPATVSVTALSTGGMTGEGTWDEWMGGCIIELPGDGEQNRIVGINGTTATFQFPHFGSATGDAVVKSDSCILSPDVITVLNPVQTRGGLPLRPASGRYGLLAGSGIEADDYGRARRVSRLNNDDQSYFVETTMVDGEAAPSVRLMLSRAAESDFVVGFNARCSLANFTTQDLPACNDMMVDSVNVPIPNEFAETLFLPLATVRFLSSPAFQNFDVGGTTNANALERAEKQAEQGFAMLDRMKRQADRNFRIYPGI